MAVNKTQATDASIEAYLASRAGPSQLADSHALIDMCKRATGEPPRMWGPSIVGFGTYRYTYASGRSGDACLAGFALRGKDMVVYLMADDPTQGERLAALGKYRMGKGCLYFGQLGDIDTDVLGALSASSVTELRRRYPAAQGSAPGG